MSAYIHPQTRIKTLDQIPCQYLKGVGPRFATLLEKCHIYTIQDILFHLPFRYQDRTRITPIRKARVGDWAVIEGVIKNTESKQYKQRSQQFICEIMDHTGIISLRFFHISPLQKSQLITGLRIRSFGEIRFGSAGLIMIHPEYQIISPDNSLPIEQSLTPIYPSTEGLTQHFWRKVTNEALIQLNPDTLIDYLPKQSGLMSLYDALHFAHRPPVNVDMTLLMSRQHPAQLRLAFEELLAHHLSLRIRRKKILDLNAPVLKEQAALTQQFLDQLSFQLTKAQSRVIKEVQVDIAKPHPMLRLIQGDVGSGKTIVAAIAAYQAVLNGYQVALMAPTEILAEQHYRQFTHWFSHLLNSHMSANLSNSPEIANLSNSPEIANLSNSPEIANLSNSPEIANLSNSSEIADLSNSSEIANLSNSSEIANLSNSPEIANLSNSPEIANLSNSPEIANLSNSPLPLAGEGARRAGEGARCEVKCLQNREKGIQNLEENSNIKVVWLSGQLKTKQRQKTLEEIQNNTAQIIIGTHALFQAEVKFAKLGLAIIDEQHRFGVAQRLALREKGLSPHQLIMTATPIPRSLAMTLYADLNLSVIDELPPGRTPIKTVVINSTRRDEIILRVTAAIHEKRQIYWVCPLIEESENLQCQAAETTAKNLAQQLQNSRVSLIHGKLKSSQKETIMQAFKNRECDLLVATTVIEVGVDVPNASLMIIENAERLGLAQLHQLRGRVGRGSVESFCILLYQPPLSQMAEQRLRIMRESNDGFVVAEKDLALRGPGELLGTRQTGLLELRVADLQRDQHLFEQIQTVATTLLEKHQEVVKPLIERWLGKNTEFQDV